MAERPVFVPLRQGPNFVREVMIEIPWASGFAPVQKKKNIKALHEAAARRGLSPILEISTKSDVVVGQHLSAFHLKLETKLGPIALEVAYQGSKVFERGGPYVDLYETEPRTAKRDYRLQASGRLIGFDFGGQKFPLRPVTVFYDWLYLTAIYPHRDWLIDRLIQTGEYAGFTDIEFNPRKSINCQARSCALFVALFERGMFEEAMHSPQAFIELMKGQEDRWIAKEDERQLSL